MDMVLVQASSLVKNMPLMLDPVWRLRSVGIETGFLIQPFSCACSMAWYHLSAIFLYPPLLGCKSSLRSAFVSESNMSTNRTCLPASACWAITSTICALNVLIRSWTTGLFDGMILATRTTASGQLIKILSINLPRRSDAPAGSAGWFKSLVPACSRTTLGRDGSDFDA